MKEKWANEKELAREVINYLKNDGWTTYPEIKDIDIVATKQDNNCKNGLRIIGIECKKHFNLTVLAQAHSKKIFVDQIFIAVSKGRKNNEYFGLSIAKKFNLGVFFVNKAAFSQKVKMEFEPIVNERSYGNIDHLLQPEAENYAEAGQAGGRQWTSFKQTTNLLINYIKENNGIELNEAIKNIKHHYSSFNSAKNALKKMIETNVIKEIKLIENKLYLND